MTAVKISTSRLLVLLSYSACAFAGVTSFPGGSNYVMASIGNYKLAPTPQNWQNSLVPVIGLYHTAPAVIRSELATLKARGQTEIVLLLWFVPFPTPTADCFSAHMVDSSQGRLCNQTAANLRALLGDIERTGFSKIYFRFAPQGKAWPTWPDGWDEAQYRQNLAFQMDARRIIVGSQGNMSVVYDLGTELGGIWDRNEQSPMRNYTLRMWNDYNMLVGSRNDTLGFSFAAGLAVTKLRVGNMLKVYQSSGETPFMWTLDIYGEEKAILEVMSEVLGEHPGELAKPFVVLECFYDDAEAYQQFSDAASTLPLKIEAVFQWPLQRKKAKTNPNFSVDYPQDFTAYMLGIAGFVDATPNPCILNAAPQCTTTITWTSNTDSCIFDKHTVFACGRNGSQLASWIDATPTMFTLHASNNQSSLLLGSIQVKGARASSMSIIDTTPSETSSLFPESAIEWPHVFRVFNAFRSQREFVV